MTSLARTERPDLDTANLSPSIAARHACRTGMASTTAGVANGFVQGNLAILPREAGVGDFTGFCQLNPKAVPDHRHVRCRRSPHSRARHRPRHPYRPAALPRVARRRGRGRADRHHGALARRSRRVPARRPEFTFEWAMLPKRACGCLGTSSAAPWVAHVVHVDPVPARGVLPTARWWCRCGRSRGADPPRRR